MSIAKTRLPLSGIRDNYRRGAVGEFLRAKIQGGSKLSVVSAYFTIYAYEALKGQLGAIEELRFLFGEQRSVKSLDPDQTEVKSFMIDRHGLKLETHLEQKRIAKEYSDWIKRKVEIRSVKQSNSTSRICRT